MQLRCGANGKDEGEYLGFLGKGRFYFSCSSLKKEGAAHFLREVDKSLLPKYFVNRIRNSSYRCIHVAWLLPGDLWSQC